MHLSVNSTFNVTQVLLCVMSSAAIMPCAPGLLLAAAGPNAELLHAGVWPAADNEP